MFWTIAVCLSFHLITRAQAGPMHTNDYTGKLPVRVARAEMLGNVKSLTTHVNRDLGFQGRIGTHVLLTYGDTLYSDGNYSETWRGMTSDSMAYATRNPVEVVDVDLNDQGYPKQFCPVESAYGEDASNFAMGITNIVETSAGQGNALPLFPFHSHSLIFVGRHPVLPKKPSTSRREQASRSRRRHRDPVPRLPTHPKRETTFRVLVGWRERALVW